MIYRRHSDSYTAARAERTRMPFRLPPALFRAVVTLETFRRLTRDDVAGAGRLLNS